MTKITVIIPVEDYDGAEKYYRDVLFFSLHERRFFLPTGTPDIALKLMIIGKEAKINFPPKKRFPIFGYKIEKNFLSYCSRLYSNGAFMEMACATPGGYYARVSDPAGNQFEIECDSFEEDESDIDLSTMPFFFTY